MSGVPIGNVQRQTFNSQLSMGVTERAHGGLDMGTDTVFGRSEFCAVGAPQRPLGQSWPAVVTRYGDRHGVRGMAEQTEGQTRYSTQTWGQARCPVYRSGTFNVKRSTLNF